MKLLLMAAVLIGFSFSASANTQAKINEILIIEDSNLIYIYPVGGVSNPPACHGSNGDYISYKLSRPLAKEYLSMLMMAFAAQKTVFLATTGTCVDQSLSETLSYIKVIN